MSNGTCAKQGDANKPMRENTDSEVFYQKYILSEETTTKLESIRRRMKENIAQANSTWKVIAGENEERICSDEDSSTDNDDAGSDDNESQMCRQSVLDTPSTQFFFTQVERPQVETENSVAALPQMCDILESVCENLERNNGRLDLAQFESLSNDDLISLADELAEKLGSKGIYNLCQSMSDMTVEQGMKYLNVLCTHLLLPKIIELEEPSRLLTSAIGECVKTFPDEIQRFIFVPILNAELKDTTLITTIVNTFDLQKRTVLLEEFLANTEELKSWHISMLQNFLSVRFDHNMIDKVTKLFSGKALCYSKDKNFGKLLLSFLKINTMLSEEQKNLMGEIIAVNETLFKRPMENLLRSM
ncbi:uncharacterized protein LOC105275889 [Ooceraea biroi]|uniref:uncharacterized protein LOC105275889 n=1 Tax=Ooceraea biroi TaxID=2015173 RepID=UPI000F0819C1|nr:uncharacterized protein LOC105275889 [Ooceraea biroi]XP_026829319.1 uncharacterized protein LOC105275889 [Ooceraea biroi]